MKNIITILCILILFCNYSCKEKSTNYHEENSHNPTQNNIDKSHENTYYQYKKWDSVIKSDDIYKFNDAVVQFKNHLDETKNVGGKKFYFNNEAIDFIISDAYVFTPYLFVNGTQKIILVQEEDEGGIYGYIVYYFNNNEVINKEYLDVSPNTDVTIDHFISFKDEKTNVEAVILTDKYYNTKLDKIEDSGKYSFILKKSKTQKSENLDSVKPRLEANFKNDNLLGLWKTDCLNDDKMSNILFYDKKEATMEIYDRKKLVAKLLLEFDPASQLLKYLGTNIIGEGITAENIIGLSKGQTIAKIYSSEDEKISIEWLGLFNEKTNQKIFVQNPFDKQKISILKKCK